MSIDLGMANSARMVDLCKHETTLFVNSINRLLPSVGVLFVCHSWSSSISMASPIDIRTFGDDEASASSLAVIFGVEFGWNPSFVISPTPGHWGHDDSVAEG